MSRASTVLAAVLAVCATAPGCDSPPTLIVVAIDTDLDVPEAVSSIHTVIQSPEGEESTAVIVPDAETAFPVTVALVHEGGRLGPFRVRVEARSDGAFVVAREASVSFQERRAVVLAMHLVEACVGHACGAGETCTEEGCASIDVGELPRWDGQVPDLESGGGTEAGVDDGGAPDADGGAAADAEVATDGAQDGSTALDAEPDAAPHPFSPVALYRFDDVGETFEVPDVSDRTPLVPLVPAARTPPGFLAVPDGLAVVGGRLEAEADEGSALGEALLSSGSLSVEAWVRTADGTQTGPARVVTYSSSASQRAFTLGQDGADVVARLRTTATGANGIETPDGTVLSLSTPAFPATEAPRQVVLVFDGASGTARVYVNGEPREEALHRDADGEIARLDWDTEVERFALGDEIDADRQWLGVLELVAIYDRPLESDEVAALFEAGPAGAR